MKLRNAFAILYLVSFLFPSVQCYTTIFSKFIDRHFSCYRIPSIIKTSKGTLLAFAENRKTNCGDNGAAHAIVLRRSTDNGKNWGDLINVTQDASPPCQGCPSSISNPNPVEVDFGTGNKAILLHFDTMNNPTTAKHGLDMEIWSYDDGLTWRDSKVLSFPPQLNLGGLIGPSVGIQSPKDGTIYFSAFSPTGGHFLYWSTDHGSTWASSENFGNDLSECSIAFLPDTPTASKLANQTLIVMSCRTGEKRRAHFLWTNHSRPSGPFFPKGLIDPQCQGSIISHGKSLFLSNCNSTTKRAMMTVKESKDGGLTWDSGRLVYSGPSAYSQLVALSDTQLGIVYEAGWSSSSEGIRFETVDI